MGKKTTSVLFIAFFLVLKSALAGYWSNSTSPAYLFPSFPENYSNTWQESPMGIFAINYTAYSAEPTVTATGDLSRSTDPGECSAEITIPNASYSGTGISWSMSGATSDSGNGQVGVKIFNKGQTTINYTATDGTSSAEDSVVITVSDPEKPTFTAPDDLTIYTDANCNYDAGVTATGDVTDENDNCSSGIQATFNDSVAAGSVAGSSVITRTWSLVDEAGNAADTQVQVITVEDNKAPTFTAPDDLTIYTDANCNYDAGVTATGDVTDENDNCSSGIQATFNDSVATGSVAGSSVITRTWSLVDEAGNAAGTQVQVITVEDNKAPTFTAPDDLTIYTDANCNYDAGVTATGDVTDENDNCSSGIQATFNDSVATGSVAGSSVITRTWSLVDEAGNAAGTQVQVITVEDNKAPTFTAPDDLTIYTDANCNYDAGVTATGDVTDENDNCSSGIQATFNDSVAAGSVAGSSVITRTWSLVDEAGNAAGTQVQVITVEDNKAPTFTAPDDLTIYNDANCNYDAGVTATGDVTDENDNCSSGIQATFNDSVAAGSVAGSSVITRTWSLVDEAGNAAGTQVQVITVEDNKAPTFTAPDDLTIYNDANCNYDAGVTATGDVTDENDNCSSGIQATFNDSVAAGSVAGSSVITRTWSLVDEAGNAADTQVQVITVEDNKAPTFTAPDDLTIYTDANCNYDAGVTATGDVTDENDNCSSGIQATFNDSVAAGSVAGSSVITRTWSLVDEAGNAAGTQVQVITVEDNKAPTFTAPDDLTIYTDANCNYDAGVTATGDVTDENDNCSSGIQATFNDSVAAGSVAGSSVITRTWSLVDEAGNAADTQVQVITVEDNKAPTFTAPDDLTIYTDANCNYDAGVTATGDVTDENDNCSSGIQATFNDSVAAGSVAGSSVITRTWSLVDEAGNAADTQVQVITVEDNKAPTFTAPDDLTIYTDANCNYDAGVTATGDVTDENDNCSSGIQATFNDSVAAGSVAGSSIITRTWSLVDEAGNAADTQVQVITVEDNKAPVTPQLEDILWGCEKTLEAPTTTDNCSGIITATATRSLTFSSSGNITWTFTDATGNSSQVIQKVTIDPLVAPIEQVNILCHGDSTGEITINASGGVAPYSYQWSDSYTGEQRTGLPVGDYSIIVSDVNGCQTSVTVRLTQPEPLAISESTFTPVTCNSAGDGTFTAGTVTGGTPQYEYKITGRSYQSTGNFRDLEPGSYTLTVLDANGCIIEEDFTITEPEELYMEEPSSTDVTCSGGNDGTVTAGNVTGGNGDYLYSINNTDFGTSTVFSSLSAGTYTIFVKDAKGCALQKTITIEEPEQLSAEIQKEDVTCNGKADGEISIVNATGGSGTYQFSMDGVKWQPEEKFSGLDLGAFTIYMRDAAHLGCTMILKTGVQITQPEELKAEVTTTRTTTYGSATGSATANPTGGTAGYTYEWTKEGDPDFLQETKTVNNLLAGHYIVKITDQNGCSIEKEKTVIDKVTGDIVEISICEDADGGIRTSTFSVDYPTILGGVGDPVNFKYSWHFGSDVSSITQSGDSYIVQYSKTGDKIITLTIEDEDKVITDLTFTHYVGNCFENCGSSKNYQIDDKSFFIGDENGDPIDGTNCESAPNKYLWFNILKSSNVYALSVELKYSINDGTHTYARTAINCFGEKVSTGNGNNKKEEYVLINPGKYKLFRISDDSNDISTISWNCGETFKIEGMTMRYLTNSGKECGDTNHMQCIGVSDSEDVSTPIVATASAEAVKCKGEALGSITVSAKGGVKPYFYSINGDIDSQYQKSSIFLNLPAGNYSNIWVKDGKGQTFHSETIKITEPSESLDATITSTNPVCFNKTGEATVAPTGGTAPYTYLWNDSSERTTSTASDLFAGEYTVTVIDSNGCQTLKTFTITQPPKLTEAQVGSDQSFGCGFTSTTLTGNNPEVGTGTWTITSGEGGEIPDAEIHNPNASFSGEAGETYVLSWTIANQNCSNSDDLTVAFAPNCSTLDFDGVDDYITFGNNYNLLSNAFTLEAWVKPKSASGIRTILSKRNSQNLSSGGYDLIINNGAPTFRWNGNSVSTSLKVSTDRWYHLAVINSGSEVKLFVDGIEVATKSSSASSPKTISSPFLIGAMDKLSTPNIPINFFKGWIEEVKIWNIALTLEQLRFMMNQRIENNNGVVKGEIMPKNVPGGLTWANLSGYYRLMANEVGASGTTLDMASNKITGYLKNIESIQQNSAPLPYISEANGKWNERSSWDSKIGEDGENFWTWPNDVGINGRSIDWNIASFSHSLESGNKNITLLGLFVNGGDLDMLGNNPTRTSEGVYSPGSGNGLTITHHLKLNGTIDLNGESQLVQTPESILDTLSTGSLERDQQGTASSYNYNYFSSPVSTDNQNSGYTVAEVLKDGSKPDNPQTINFNYQYHWADGARDNSKPIKISTFWINKFFGAATEYSAWEWLGKDAHLNTGEGFTMKGSSGNGAILELQNYTFRGMPNNGDINLFINPGQNYLVGNPYPSAIDANQFIKDNLKDITGGNNDRNVFNGSLYFWSHFSGKTHYLERYVGGYAIYNLSGGIKAIANDARIKATGEEGGERPQQYIPVGQAFFVNSVLDENITKGFSNITLTEGDIHFKNSQRVFVTEADQGKSVFHSAERKDRKMAFSESSSSASLSASALDEERQRFWLEYKSPAGYHRQLLVTRDPETTMGFDLGYDAVLTEDNLEDMYWLINGYEFVIQGVPDFGADRSFAGWY